MDLLKIENGIMALTANDKFSGCIQISTRDECLFKESYGYASRAYMIENNIDTKFNIASVGKSITSVAILHLAEKGILDLFVPITRYCDSIIPKIISDKITIQHLLTHTSGLGDFFNNVYSSSYQTAYLELNDFKKIIKDSQISFEPGSKQAYSNLGYLLLGFIIQNMANTDYYNYIEKNIFEKAGMNDSGFWFYDEVLENAATAYFFDDMYKKWRCFANRPSARGTSCGGCYSTVGDLTKFMNALFNGTFIGSELLKEAITAKPELHSPSYGYGFYVSDDEIGHSGDGIGVNAKLIRKKDGMVIAILSNLTNGAYEVESLLNE